MSRKKARESAMSLIYQMDLNEDFSEESIKTYLENFEHSIAEEEYVKDASNKIMMNLEEIDKYINKNLTGWTIERLAKVDLSVLRVALYEILYREDIPIEVSINEAIETVRKYSAEDSYRFINGVLGGVIRSIENE